MTQLVEFGVAFMASALLVGSWSVVCWRRYALLRQYKDRRAWSSFLLSGMLLAAAIAFAG